MFNAVSGGALRACGARIAVVGLTGLAVALLASPVHAQQGVSYWQLRFEYAGGDVALADATPIAPTTKRITHPGLEGAALTYDVTLEWLDETGVVIDTALVTLPFGTRTILTEGTRCESFIPDEGVVVIRVPGPDADTRPAGVRLRGSEAKALMPELALLPAPFRPDTLELEILEVGGGGAKDGPINSTLIQNTGPNSNRLVIVLCGDGYTNSNLQSGAFATHANNLLSAFYGLAPWTMYFDHTNVYRVNTASNQSGADNIDSPSGPLKDTYYHSAFWTSGIERLLTISSTGASRAVQAADSLVGAGVWDYVFVLVNSDKYGGSGGPISVSSIHSDASEVILHEFGHTFAGLADEYESSIPGAFIQDPEPNVDRDAALSLLKWRHWVPQGTPLPTPETSQYSDVVGAFEGARYFSSGIYRPWQSCLMRDLGRPFCPVCAEEHTISFFEHVSLIDGSTHSAGSTISVGSGGVTVRVTPLGISPLTYRWRMNNQTIQGQTGSQIDLTPSMVPSGSNVLSVEVTHNTSLVRKTTISDSRSWTVQSSGAVDNDDCSNATPIFLGQAIDGNSGGALGNQSVCGTNDRRDVWHTFTSPINGVVRFTTCLGANFDTTLAVYDECSGNLLGCNDNFCGQASEVEIPVALGEDYYVRVAGVNNGTGSYTLLAEQVQSTSCCRDGDVNQDGDITPADALMVFEFYTQKIQLDLCSQYHADVRNPEDPPSITPNDAQCIFQFFLGEPGACSNLFPQPCSN